MKACWVMALVGLMAMPLAGCAPKIGKGCSTSSDCSVSGDRVCDTTQPGGYCTIQFCNPDTCPDNAVCVEWRYDPPRTAETWCMKRCSSDKDCRHGYHCFAGRTLPADAGTDAGTLGTAMILDGGTLLGPDCLPLARVVDIKRPGRFCAAIEISNAGACTAMSPGLPMDAGSPTDAGSLLDGGTADAAPDAM